MGAFCIISKCFLICHCLRFVLVWATSPSGCDHVLFSYLSSRPTLLYLHKMNNQHLEGPFSCLLKWVDYRFIFHCLSNRCCLLSEDFSALPVPLAGWNASCPSLCRAAHGCWKVSGSAAATGKGIEVPLLMAGQRGGGGCCSKMEKRKQVQNRCRQVPTAVEAAWHRRKSIGFGTKPTWVEIPDVPFTVSMCWAHCIFFKYRFLTPRPQSCCMDQICLWCIIDYQEILAGQPFSKKKKKKKMLLWVIGPSYL